MAVERARSQGKVVVTSMAEGTFDSAEDVEVQVDDEAAARASFYSELKSATDGDDTSKFVVEGRSWAAATSDVYVGINHFSTREVTMSEGSATSTGNGPSFGVLAALVALVGSVLVVAHRIH